MPRRIAACFPFSTSLGITSRAGQGPIYSGAQDAAQLAYYLHSATGLAASIRAPFEGPHIAGRDQGAVAIESATTNMIVTVAGEDAIGLSDWPTENGVGTCVVTRTVGYATGPWGSDGPAATLFVKTGDPGTVVIAHANIPGTPGGSEAVAASLYLKVLVGSVKLTLNGGTGADTTVTAGSGWTRATSQKVGPNAYGVELYGPSNGADVTFLACCGQVELAKAPTSFVDGTRPGGKLDVDLDLDSQNFTFASWVAPSLAVADVDSYMIAITENNSTVSGKRMVCYRPSGLNGVTVFLGTSESSSTSTNFATTWTDGEWHHIAMSVSAGVAIVYIDGVTVGTATGIMRRLASTTVGIGSQSSLSRPLNGLLADTVFFDSPLSAAEIAALYVTTPVYGSLDDLTATLAPQTEIPITHAGGPQRHMFADGSSIRAAMVPVSEDRHLLVWDGLSYAEAQTLRDLWDANGAGFGPIDYTPAGQGKAHPMHGVPGTFRETLRQGRAAITFELERD